MPRAGFEHAISTSQRPKTVLASDRSAIEIGLYLSYKAYVTVSYRQIIIPWKIHRCFASELIKNALIYTYFVLLRLAEFYDVWS
jgi:hypothetical protein